MKIRHVLIGTAMGLGFSPIAPGTVGALGGWLIWALLTQFAPVPNMVLSLLIVLFYFLGVYSSGKLETEWGQDPSKVVIDEVVGMWIAVLFIPSGWEYALVAILLFRFFDIYKPLFIRKAEGLNGGWGIMTDDVLAGIYANILIQLFVLFQSI